MAQKPNPLPSPSPPRSGDAWRFRTAGDVPPGVTPAEVRTIANSVIEEAEILHASLKAGSVAQIVVAIIAIVGLLYLLKFVMATILLALLLAFILEPLVHQLTRISLPRSAAALIVVVLAAATAGGVGYFLFDRLGDFATELPKYSERIERALARIQEPVSKLESTTRALTPPPIGDKEPVPVEIRQSARLFSYVGGQ